MGTSPRHHNNAPPKWADANCQAVLEAAPDAMLVVNRAGEILAANLQAEKLFGLSREQLIGRVVESLLPVRFRDRHRQHRERFLANPETQFMQVPGIFGVRSDTSEFPADVNLGRLTIGSETFAISAIRDATERRRLEELKRAEAVLREKSESEERFRLAAQAGKMYAYEWDVATDLVVRSEEQVNVLGFSEPRQLTRQELLARVHPEDRALVVASVDQLTPQYPTTQISYRVLRPDGSIVWLEKNAKGFFDDQGKLLRVIGMVANITERKQMDEALRESENKLRLILDSTAEAIYGVDLEHRCTFCNPACLRALGYERLDEVLGKNIHNLIHHTRADGTSFPVEECGVHRVTRTGEGVHAEDEMFWRANGTSFPAEYWSYPQRRLGEVVGAVVAFVDITERKLTEAALAGVSRKLLEAQEQERARIARELHDDISQRLAMLAIEIEQLQEHAETPSEVRERVDELSKRTKEISTDVQALSHELHSSKLEYLGIVGGMKSWCSEFGERQETEIEFKSSGLPNSLPSEISLCLFRVLQEALHNAAKHSGVKRVDVQLREESCEIHLIVSDLGRGFDVASAMQDRGLGVTSMQERVRLVGGTIVIDSKPLGGTTIHVRVPLGAERSFQKATG